MALQNLQNAAKTILGVKFVTLSGYIRKTKMEY